VIWLKLKVTFNMITFEHTVFALPFALISALIAAGGLPSGRQILWIVLAMVGARSAAMAFNRIIDLDYDKVNPRTRNRALPSGRLSVGFAVLFTLAASALFVVSAGMLNRLCLYLALPTLGILFGYSYTKRFTWMSHILLGFAIGLAPLGAWLAITGEFALVPILLTWTVTLWIAGFDIIYACQDREFDLGARLRSLPARWGLRRALRVSSLCHVGTVVLLLSTAYAGGLGVVAFGGIVLVAGILYWEHRIVRPDDLGRVNVAFFTLNGYVSLLLLGAFATDILIG
jgi:4-hydroxybenzoate polyprenyltransferase